jgi:hypothetical protein
MVPARRASRAMAARRRAAEYPYSSGETTGASAGDMTTDQAKIPADMGAGEPRREGAGGEEGIRTPDTALDRITV